MTGSKNLLPQGNFKKYFGQISSKNIVLKMHHWRWERVTTTRCVLEKGKNSSQRFQLLLGLQNPKCFWPTLLGRDQGRKMCSEAHMTIIQIDVQPASLRSAISLQSQTHQRFCSKAIDGLTACYQLSNDEKRCKKILAGNEFCYSCFTPSGKMKNEHSQISQGQTLSKIVRQQVSYKLSPIQHSQAKCAEEGPMDLWKSSKTSITR